MEIIVASDEKTELTDAVIAYLEEKGNEVELCGALIGDNAGWADIGFGAAKKVVANKATGIFFCWSGTGICMAANKVKGARAALCWDAEIARLARKWNDPNILCLSLRFTSVELAKDIIDAWFSTEFDEEGLGQAHKLDSK